MAATVKQIQDLLQKEFKQAAVTEIVERNRRIGGRFYSPEFVGMSPIKRVELVRTRVLNNLGLNESNVGIIVPLAPGEKY